MTDPGQPSAKPGADAIEATRSVLNGDRRYPGARRAVIGGTARRQAASSGR